MTQAQIAARVEVNLHDSGVSFFTSQDVSDSVQEGYTEVTVLTGCIEKSATFQFPVGTAYVDLYNSVPDFFRCIALYSNAINMWLEHRAPITFDSNRLDWELASYTPWFYTVLNFQWIAFFTHYATGATASATFELLYRAVGEYLAPTAVPQIPDQFQNILVFYATAEMLEQYQEFSKAKRYWDDYGELLGLLQKDIKERMQPGKMLVYNGGEL
jgi:hypothetical protein